MAGNSGALVVSLGLDGAEFFAGLSKAEYETRRAVQGISNSLSSMKSALAHVAGAFGVGIGVGAFVRLISSTIEAADHLENLSKSTGIAVEQLGGLGFAASQTGGSLDDMASSFKKFNVNIAAAAAGSEKEQEVFRALGISLRDLQTLKPDQLFIKAADAFASFDEGADKSALGAAAFGKAYQGIIPTLDQGGKKLQDNIEYFKRFGGVSSDTAKQASEFEAELTKIHLLSGAFARNLTADLLPQMKVLADALLDSKEKGNQFADSAQHVADIITNLAVGVAYLAHWFDGLGEAIGAAAARMDRWAHLDFKGARFIAEDEETRVEKAGKDFDALIAKIRGAQQNPGFSIGFASDVRPPTRPPPRLSSTSGVDAAKKELERDLAALDNFIKSEEELLKQRESFLQDYYQHDELSITDFFGARQAARDEALEKERQALDKEAALLTARINVSKPTERADDEKKLGDVIARRQKLEQEAAISSVKGFVEQKRAADAFQKSIEEIALRVTELRGDDIGAATFGFDLQNAQIRKQIDLEKESNDERIRGVAIIGDKYLNELRQRTIEQAKVNAAAREYSLITGRLAIEQGRIDLLAQTGALTEIGAINKRADLSREYVSILSKQADEQQRLAESLSAGPLKDTAILNVQRLRLEIEQLAAASDVLAKKFSDIFSGAFSTFLTDIVNHTKTVKQAFLDMAKSIEQSISKIAADQVSQQLFGKGGPLGDVGGFFAKMFGGKESGATGAAGADASLSALAGTTGIADTALVGLTASLTAAAGAATMFSISATAGGLSGAFMGSGAGGLGAILGPGGLFGFAEGGNPPVGKISLVGEKGPELFVPKQAGTIIPFTALPATSVAKVRQMIDFGGFFADGGDPPLGKISVVGEKGPELFVPRQAGTVIPFTVTPTKAAVTIPDFAGLFSPGESAAETKTPDFRSPKLQDFHSPFFAAPSMAVPDFGVKLVPAAPDFSFKFSLVAEKTPPFSGRTAPSLTTKASFGGVFNPPLAGPVPGFGFPPFKFSLAAPVFSAASHPPVVSVFLPTPLSIGSSASPSTKVPDFGGHKPPSIGFAVPAKNTMDFGFHPHQFSIHHGASVITRLVEPVFSTVSPSLATKLPDFGFRLGDGRTLTSAGIVPDFHFSLVAEKSPALLAGSAPIKVPDFGFRSFLQDFGGFFAGGGDPPVGKFSMVGEHGPELFMPKQAGTIIPFDQVRGRRSSKSIEIGAINVNVPASTSGPSATQIANRTVRELQRSAAKG